MESHNVARLGVAFKPHLSCFRLLSAGIQVRAIMNSQHPALIMQTTKYKPRPERNLCFSLFYFPYLSLCVIYVYV